MEYNVHTLSNGIRLLHVPTHSTISHACILINAGSRHEPEDKQGVAHFIEHLLFKRTEKRQTNQILNRLESVGADVNAYTTKEYTCLHASFLNPYLDRTLELFNDIVFHSTFPEAELKKEKSIILDEIASYQDQPEEAIYDDFEDLIFTNHPLGHNILGTIDSVKQLQRSDVLQFIKDNYHTNEIVVAVFGNYSFNQIIKTGSRYYNLEPANIGSKNKITCESFPVINLTSTKNISQAHCVIGAPSYSLHHPFKTGFLLLNNLLGGNGMSSILNLEIREKHGIAYTIDSGYSPLSDTGLFTIYFGTDVENIKKARKLIFKELKKLRENSLGEIRLQKAKKKFIGQIALGEEGKLGLLISMAKSLIDYNRIDSLETVFSKIEAVTTAEIQQIANEMLNENKLSSLLFIPEED